MKRTFLSILFIFVLTIASFAQFAVGIKAGGNFTNVLTTDKTEGHKFVPGFHVGLLAQVDISEFISFQTEAVYSRKGFKQQSSSTTELAQSTITSNTRVQYSYSYIDVPLLLNIHFGQMGSYVGLGPQLSFLAGAKWDGFVTNTTTTKTTPITTTSIEVPQSGNDKAGYSKVDFGAVIGTGSKFDSGIEYCLRAGYGFTNVIDPSATLSNDIWHNLVFTVSLGYTFHFGGGQGDRYGHKYNKPKRRH